MHALPLRYVMPSLIAAFALIVAALSHFSSVGPAIERIEQQRQVEMRDQVILAKGVLEAAIGAQDMPGVRRFLASIGAHHQLDALVLTDKAGEVIAANKRRVVGKNWKDLNFEIDPLLINEISKSKGFQVRLSPEKSHVFGIIRICTMGLSRASDPGLCGFLYFSEDIRADKNAVIQSLRKQAVVTSGGILIVGLLFIIIFDRLLTMRVRKLVEVTDNFVSGREESRAGLKGKDEIAIIGRAIDSMLDHISSSQKALVKSEYRFEVSQKFAKIGSWEWNIKTGELHWSSAIAPMFGYGEGELKTNYKNFVAAIHPVDRQSVLDALALSLETGVGYEIEHRVVWPNGDIRWLHERGNIIRDEAGKSKSMLGIVQDITELKRQQEELIQFKKMESLGSLTAGIAHNLNNFLQPIGMCGELLLRNYPEESDERELLTRIIRSNDKASHLVQQLTAYSRNESIKKKVYPIYSLIDEILDLLESSIPTTVSFRRVLGEDTGNVLLDTSQIQTVVMNLVSNAVDALESETGKIIVTLYQKEEGACFTVIDTGTGMNDETIERMFDPFFTTKEIGKGTGLGLSTVQGIVMDHGGTINCSSSLEKGTTIEVLFPLVANQKPSIQAN